MERASGGDDLELMTELHRSVPRNFQPGPELVLVKYGGAAMDDPAARLRQCAEIALLRSLGMRVVVVHGGGKEVSRWMSRLGLEARFVNGYRYTDDAGIEIAEMVLSGKINAELVALISRFGGRAIGLSGRDAGLFRARRLPELGNVGEGEDVSPDVILSLMNAGFVPVVSSIGADATGAPLNINADHMAAEIAVAVGAARLLLLTDVDAVHIAGAPVRRLTAAEARELLAHPDVTGGMVPKLRDAAAAVERGVGSVQIVNGSRGDAVLRALFDVGSSGTTVCS